MRWCCFLLIFFFAQTLFAFEKELIPPKEGESLSAGLVKNEEKQKLLSLFEKSKEEYLSKAEKEDLKSLPYLKHLKKKNDLDGGLLLLFGTLFSGVGVASFFLSDFFYQEYKKAESTERAIFYREATQATDAFKLIFTLSGLSVFFSSLYFFLQEPEEKEIACRETLLIKVKEDLFVH